MGKGLFPKQIEIGIRGRGWLQHEVDQWIRDQVERTRGTKPQPKAAPAETPGQGETN